MVLVKLLEDHQSLYKKSRLGAEIEEICSYSEDGAAGASPVLLHGRVCDCFSLLQPQTLG